MTEIIYTPGVCNIGPEEIAQRKKVGALAFIATIVLALVFLYWSVPTIVRIILFVPAFVSAIGLIQAYAGFCVAFAQAGIFNFGALGTKQTVAEAEAHKKDQRQARKLMFYAALAALVFTAFICVI